MNKNRRSLQLSFSILYHIQMLNRFVILNVRSGLMQILNSEYNVLQVSDSESETSSCASTHRPRPHHRTGVRMGTRQSSSWLSRSSHTQSDPECTSGSEQSTVINVGGTASDRDFTTDSETCSSVSSSLATVRLMSNVRKS